MYRYKISVFLGADDGHGQVAMKSVVLQHTTVLGEDAND